VTSFGNALSFSIGYWTSAFAESQVNSIANAFSRALSQIVKNCKQQVKSLTICSKADFNQILAWNAKVPERIESCVHDLIHQRSQEQPQAIAVCSWDGVRIISIN
jgi:non-ribosomal peptide synthetase component F